MFCFWKLTLKSHYFYNGKREYKNQSCVLYIYIFYAVSTELKLGLCIFCAVPCIVTVLVLTNFTSEDGLLFSPPPPPPFLLLLLFLFFLPFVTLNLSNYCSCDTIPIGTILATPLSHGLLIILLSFGGSWFCAKAVTKLFVYV